jgi:hydrogenase maturation protein HypF
VELWDRSGRKVSTKDPISEAAQAIGAGLVVAVKGLGGFHLAADGTNASAVALLRRRKRRVEKPFAVMVPDIDAANALCEVDESSRKLLQTPQRPIVLLPKRALGPVVEEVAPFHRYLGLFLPYTPIHYLLFDAAAFRALVMTSGNLSEEPIAITNDEAADRLSGLADYFLVHNRDILLRCDDSVVRVAAGKTRQMRRSRGFVPVPVFLKEDLPLVLGVGGELKNTICLTKGRHAFLSQHVGDLENVEGYKFFEEAVAHLENILEIGPDIVAYDLHPNYFSTKWALQQNGKRLVGVQHHHAHVASCMAENHVDGKVIGFALDGTGYGTDGQIWGGEILIADYKDFQRAAHFEYVGMPGGAAVIREPWRMAVSYLAHHFGRDFFSFDIPFIRQLKKQPTELLIRMLERNVNAPLTSSCGRLFDAVAALAGVRQKVNYEAQAAIELEMMMDDADDSIAYAMDVQQKETCSVIGTRPLFESLIGDLQKGTPSPVVSKRFHNGLVEVFAKIANALRQRTSLNRVCLSGGTFHNTYLLEKLTSKLAGHGFEVFTHSEVPAGDGGLSLGQAMVAAHRCRS